MVFVFIFALVFVVQYFFHGQIWTLALICFLVAGLLGKTAWGVFFAAFFAIFLLWSGMAFWQDIQNDQILSGRIAQMLGISAAGEWLFIFTGFFGAVVASFSALSGYYVKRIFIKVPPITLTSGR